MSQTSASGSGGAVTPGWYTDPHDPSQLRWWSGEGWTEHVSPGTAEPQVAQQATAVSDPSAPLPSRRALRDPATEASEAAEAALAAQAAQQQAAQQALADQQAQAAAAAAAAPQQAAQQAPLAAQQPEPAVQPQTAQPQAAQPEFGVPVAAQQPSVPVPTLPVAPTTFLEQQGYAPLDGVPTDATAWNQPAAAPTQATQPVQPADLVQPTQPASALPPVEAAQPNAWNQPVQATQATQPTQPAVPNTWSQPLQPVQPQTGQPLQPVQPVQPSAPNAWNQPVQPAAPDQQAWGAPSATDGMDSLFGAPSSGAAPSSEIATAAPQVNQWGLTPTDVDSASTHRAAEAAEVAGSSSVWAWLIAISPILAAGAIAYVVLTTKPALTDWPFEAAVAAPYLLVLLFALADRAVLLRLGHTQPRSPAWALLSAPVYLIVRASETRREDGSGTALTLAWFVSFVVAIAGIVGYGFLTHHALIAGLPT